MGLLLGSWHLGACQLGTDLSGYAGVADSGATDGSAEPDVLVEAQPGQGGAGGGGAAGGSAGDAGGVGGAGGGSPACGDGVRRCARGVLQELCANGDWRIVADCESQGRRCDGFTRACEKRCSGDGDCRYSQLVDGEFCRADGRCAPKIFETVWQVEEGDLSIRLPHFDAGAGQSLCNFRVLWGDEPAGTSIENAPLVSRCDDVSQREHTYAKAGVYQVKITGIYRGWGVDPYDPLGCSECADCPLKKLRRVLSFGPVGLTRGAFACTGKIEFPATDVPDPTWWTDGARVFYASEQNSSAVAKWDVSNLTIMHDMFAKTKAFNQPLGAWNTSNVSMMRSVFWLAEAFNQPLGTWDTSSVTRMEHLFSGAKAFNQPLGTWDTSKVVQIDHMFVEASAFDQDVSKWPLRRGLNLEGIFESSGLGRENYCKLLDLPVWRENLLKLGIVYTCD